MVEEKQDWGAAPYDKQSDIPPIGASDVEAQRLMRIRAVEEALKEESYLATVDAIRKKKASEYRENYRANGKRFGKWLSETRKRMGLKSQTDFAIKCGLAQPAISRIEAGRIGQVRPETLAVMAWALGISDWEILTRAGMNVNAKWEFKDTSGIRWEIEKPLGDPTQPIDRKTAELLAVLGFVKRCDEEPA